MASKICKRAGAVFCFFVGFFVFLSVCAQAHGRRVVRLACVDCYGSASYYPSEARKMFPDIDFQFFHIQTSPVSEGYVSSWERTRHEYVENFRVDLEDPSVRAPLGRRLRELGVIYAISGMGNGAYRSGWVNRELGTSIGYNNPDTRDLRRHKYLSQKALRKYGIPTLCTKTWEEALEFIRQQDSVEIVFKLPKSGGGEQMHFIRRSDEAELERVFKKLVTIDKDHHDQEIDGIILQPKILGREFVTEIEDASVLAGIEYHRVTRTDFFKHLYLIDRFLPLDQWAMHKLQDPVKEMSRDLGHEYGPAHAEWMITPEGKVYFIEMESRLGGTYLPMIEKAVYGTSPLHEELRRVIDPIGYRKKPPKPQFLQHGMQLSLIALEHGQFSLDADRYTSGLSTLIPVAGLGMKSGDRFRQTMDLNSAAASFGFAGTFPKVWSDVRQLLVASTTPNGMMEYDEMGAGGCSKELLYQKHESTIHEIWNQFEMAQYIGDH